jgi:hypothetical protein
VPDPQHTRGRPLQRQWGRVSLAGRAIWPSLEPRSRSNSMMGSIVHVSPCNQPDMRVHGGFLTAVFAKQVPVQGESLATSQHAVQQARSQRGSAAVGEVTIQCLRRQIRRQKKTAALRYLESALAPRTFVPVLRRYLRAPGGPVGASIMTPGGVRGRDRFLPVMSQG